MYFLISDTHKFIIGWSAKCGCSTLKYCFLRSENIDVEKLSDVHEICRNSYQPALGPKYQRYRKYLFVRNPYTRLVSFFLNRYWENNSIENNKFMLSNNLTTFVNLVDFLFSKGFTFDTHHCELQTHNIESFQSFKYSWDDLVKDGSTYWDGVRNYQARNNLKAMKKGDLVLYYHSNEGKEVVGIAKVTKEFYQDPTIDDDRWVVVDIEPVSKLNSPVTLASIKGAKSLQKVPLVTHSRLSVMPVTKKDYETIVKMGK